LTSFDDHSGAAGKVLRVLESFADEMTDRGVPAHLEQVVREGVYLKASRLGQTPERFVEKYLVWPTLTSLGYEFWSQPHGYPKWDASRPDFAVQNFDPGVECAVVGEVKTPNKFEYADNQIREYLSRDLEEATIGFATDGCTWQAYARPERDPVPIVVASCDFSAAFEQMPARHLERESYSPHAVRQTMSDAETLTRSSVESGVGDVLSS
jgi:hypothetical protein